MRQPAVLHDFRAQEANFIFLRFVKCRLVIPTSQQWHARVKCTWWAAYKVFPSNRRSSFQMHCAHTHIANTGALISHSVNEGGLIRTIRRQALSYSVLRLYAYIIRLTTRIALHNVHNVPNKRRGLGRGGGYTHCLLNKCESIFSCICM